ncbi:MAG: ABC transporter ATP-binding protein [Candidatus Dormibacterales bacterium]
MTATQPYTANLTPALRVSGLRVTYGSILAVDGIDLEVREGEIYGLLCPNGAGKTSALSAIEGLLRPVAGDIVVGGVDARAHRLQAKAQLGVHLQATSFHSNLTLLEVVRLFAGLYGVTLSPTQIRELLGEINLQNEASKRFRELSGGQQQRFSLLIATIHDPALVLLDEPTAGLDPQARRQLWDRIERFRKEGRSILLTTHSMEEAQAVCDRVAIMDHGKILTVGTPAALIAAHRDDPQVRQAAHGEVTLEDVFIGLTGRELRD